MGWGGDWLQAYSQVAPFSPFGARARSGALPWQCGKLRGVHGDPSLAIPFLCTPSPHAHTI